MVSLMLLVIKLIFSLFCGFILLYIFSRIIISLDAIPNYWDEKESEFINKETAINNKIIGILCQIGSPEDNGKFSDRQISLWSQYNSLQKEYDDLFAKHIQVTVYHNEE